jgi:hypothetical protein
MSEYLRGFFVIIPIALIFYAFLTILIYRAFYSKSQWSGGRLAIAGISAVVGIAALIVSMVSISHYIPLFQAAREASDTAPFTWSFLPYVIIMAVSTVVLVLATWMSGTRKTA